MYDIIGDIHGHASLLKKLLTALRYEKKETGYSHPERKAIFVGDLINRGPEIRKTVRIVRKMVENGNALAILGNHEINAVSYHLKFKKGDPLLRSPGKNFLSLYKTINEFSGRTDEWLSHLKWFRTLPLFLDLKDIRIVHACWSDSAIQFMKANITDEKIQKSFFKEAYRNSSSETARNLEILTRGIDFKMPGDLRILSNKGISPRTFRLRWWENPAGKTFEEMSFESKFTLPSYTIPKEIIPECFTYPENDPIVFFGHYCRFKGPHIIKPNVCCVDSCVNGTKTLTAYTWSGEKELKNQNLVQIAR